MYHSHQGAFLYPPHPSTKALPMRIIIAAPDAPTKSITLNQGTSTKQAKKLVASIAICLPSGSRVSLMDADELIFQVENH